MARQNNILQLTGSIGNLVNYERKGGYFSRVKPDEVHQSENTQKASVEFGRASTAASRLMKGFYPLINSTTHSSAYNRLTRAFTNMMHGNATKAVGKRIITDGNPASLVGFQFNDSCSQTKALKILVPPVRVVPKLTLSLDLPSFCPEEVCLEKPNAVAIRIQLICMVSDFLLDEGKIFRFEELDLALENKLFEGGTVSIPLTGTHHKLVIWGMSVQYLSKGRHPYRDKNYTAVDIIDAFFMKKGERVVFPTVKKITTAEEVDAVEKIPWKFRQEEKQRNKK